MAHRLQIVEIKMLSPPLPTKVGYVCFILIESIINGEKPVDRSSTALDLFSLPNQKIKKKELLQSRDF